MSRPPKIKAKLFQNSQNYNLEKEELDEYDEEDYNKNSNKAGSNIVNLNLNVNLNVNNFPEIAKQKV